MAIYAINTDAKYGRIAPSPYPLHLGKTAPCYERIWSLEMAPFGMGREENDSFLKVGKMPKIRANRGYFGGYEGMCISV